MCKLNHILNKKIPYNPHFFQSSFFNETSFGSYKHYELSVFGQITPHQTQTYFFLDINSDLYEISFEYYEIRGMFVQHLNYSDYVNENSTILICCLVYDEPFSIYHIIIKFKKIVLTNLWQTKALRESNSIE